jgi:cytochrome c oxidase assembly protein subunit 20
MTSSNLSFNFNPSPMADDTRQSKDKEINIRDFNANPENKAFSGEQWKEEKAKYYKPPQNANVLAGGTENTAGGKLPEVSIGAAFEGGLRLSDFIELPKRPCVKDSSINAMIAAFAVGGLRTVFGCELCRP